MLRIAGRLPNPWQRSAPPDLGLTNKLYDLIDERYFDGAVLVSTGLCRYVDTNRLIQRLPKLKKIALCSLGLQIPGVPSVTLDSAMGTAQAVEHLITSHHRRKLAFLGAKWPDADIDRRREVFLETVRTHGLEVPSHRILECWLEPASAESAVSCGCQNRTPSRP